MPVLEKQWKIKEKIPFSVDQALSDYPPIFRQLIHNRGQHTREQAYRFIQAEPPGGTNPSEMLGIEESVERLEFAIRRQEKIAIYGDYDVDGVTATALLVQFLENLGADVMEYIPNRFEEGYGLNKEALSTLRESGVQLVITVDCGIRSPDEARFAASSGMDLIISDHHHPGPELPQAFAIINPKQSLDTYPDKNLAGVGLAYKLAAGLAASLDNQDSLPDHLQAENYLDLVALGTVADLAPLTGENRALVRRGMNLLRQPVRQGVQSLIGVSGLIPRRISTGDIGFILGPRLNAAGRLDSALTALKLLISQDVQEAGYLALKLDDQNRDRQKLTLSIQTRVEEILKDEVDDAMLLFAAHEKFNPGLVGLVASRLTERYYRPSIVGADDGETTRASCRSIPEFHITNALDQCAALLEHHGGHAAAAGFTVRNENLPELMDRMHSIAREELTGLTLKPSLDADLELPLNDLKPEILQYLDWLEPTGQGNPYATFVSRNLRVTRARKVGRDESHLKLTVTDGSITYDAIAFRLGYWLDQMPPEIDLLYTFEVNEFRGRQTLQLNVKDIKSSRG